MELEELRTRAGELFPLAVSHALKHIGLPNPPLDSLGQLCWSHFEELGFDCQADCFAAVAPKAEGRLCLEAWSRADLEICGWQVNVLLRPFYLGASYAHFEVRHDGPLPGFTGTGYRSVFTPLTSLADRSPEEFLAELIPPRPREQQLSLF
ncbi:hypothetical protein [Luteolibacter sp.]|uniref:hypothetical protein n=1 Tax=Luteolibacter sp. TaxID=1962973 RepID=UPI003267CFD9